MYSYCSKTTYFSKGKGIKGQDKQQWEKRAPLSNLAQKFTVNVGDAWPFVITQALATVVCCVIKL